MKIKMPAKDLLFILSLVVIFAQYIKIIDFNYYSQFIVASLWICNDFLNYLYRGKYNGKYAENIKFFEIIFLLPWLVIAIYTFFDFFLLNQNINVPFNTYLGCILTILINIMFAFSSLRIFKERTLKDSIVALFIIFAIIAVKAFINYGPLIIFTQLFQIITTLDSKNNPFEIGDCTFAAGLVLLVYWFYGKKKTKKEHRALAICALFIVLGLKRIQILSLLLVIVVGLFLKLSKSKAFKNTVMNIASFGVIVSACIYIRLIDNDVLLSKWTSLDMGRYHLYSFMNNYFDFDIRFLGHGYGFSNKFVDLNTSFSITVLHSDILRMFVELGFIGFFIWLIYYLFLARKKIEQNYGIEYAYIFFFMTIYLMITYFTDNTVNYFATQYFYCILLPSFAMENKFFMKKV